MEIPTNKTRHFPKSFSNTDAEIEFFQRKEHYGFVPEDNPFMLAAKASAIKHSLTSVFPIGIVAVKDGKVVAEAGNGNGYHEKNLETPGHKKGCIRRYVSEQMEKEGKPKLKSGEGFELCPGCGTASHAEANLINGVSDKNIFNGADIYMYGHFWCCKDCWDKMQNAKINMVYLPDTYEKFKDKKEVEKWAEEVKKAKEGI